MHSLWIQTDLKSLAEQLDAKLDEDMFLEALEQRLKDPSIKFCRNLEKSLVSFGGDKYLKQARKLVETFHQNKDKEEKSEIEKQKQRLKTAEEKLKKKKTKTAETEVARAKRKIEKLKSSIARRNRSEFRDYESRIFPFYYAPLIVIEGQNRWIRPFRYHCRPSGKPESFDKDYGGTYKARKDSLTAEYFERIKKHGKGARSVWEPLFGKKHGVLAFSRFYEHVEVPSKAKTSSKKKSTPGKKVVLGFSPKEFDQVLVPCLHDVWKSKAEATLLRSFAIITDDSPPEIQQAGYHRCPIFLKQQYLETWLKPVQSSSEKLHEILSDVQKAEYKLVA